MMDGELQDGLCHHLLINAFELRERLEQKVVHVRAVVADIDENFPRLEDLAHELEVLETEAIFQDVVRGKLEMGIDLGDVLVERRPQRRELAVPVCIGLNYELLWLSQLRILCKLRNTIKQEKDPVNGIFRKLLRLAIYMKLNEFLPEDLEYLIEDLLFIRRLQHGQSDHDSRLGIQFESFDGFLQEFQWFRI